MRTHLSTVLVCVLLLLPGGIFAQLSQVPGSPSELTPEKLSEHEVQAKAASREQLELLTEALRKAEEEIKHWAYTETVRDLRTGSETVTRFDPSKPEAERMIPLRVAGKEPSEKELRKWSRKLTKSRVGRESIGGRIDIERALVQSETQQEIVFDAPLKQTGKLGVPMDKLQLLVHVAKGSQTIDKVELGLRHSFRVLLLVKITGLSGTVDCTTVVPEHPPQPTHIVFHGEARFFFKKFNGNFEATRSDFKRVKSYDERFNVTIGELKTLGM